MKDETISLKEEYGTWNGAKLKEQVTAAELRRIAYRPTLIIGLGGTGLRVVRTLKRRIQQFFGEENPEIFQFLVFDTDQEREERLDPGEFIYLGNIDGNRVVDNVSIHDYIRPWWPQGYRPGFISTGAHAVRCIGRLALFHNIDLVLRCLQDAITRSMSIHAYASVDFWVASPKVYIISSLCGGTGSGVFLDVAYLTRHMISSYLSYPSLITAILVMPDVFSPLAPSLSLQRRWQANAYAALKELDYFMSSGDYAVEYVHGFNVETTDKPFDICYIVEAMNENSQTSSIDGILDVIAEEVFIEITSPRGEYYLASAFDNVDRTVNISLGKITAYSSFGVASSVFPIEKIASYCAARNYIDFIDKALLFSPTNIEDEAKKLVDQFTGTQMIRETGVHEVIDQLDRDAQGNRLGGLEVAGDEFRVPRTALKDTIFKVEEARLALLYQHSETMAKRRREMYGFVAQALQDQVEAILVDAEMGLMVALRFLESLHTRLTGFKVEETEKEVLYWATKIRELGEPGTDSNELTILGIAKAEIEKALHFRASFFAGTRVRRALGNYVDACNAVLQAHFQLELRKHTALFYADLLKEIEIRKKQLDAVKATLRTEQNAFQASVKRFAQDSSLGIGKYTVAVSIVDEKGLEALYHKYAIAVERPSERTDALKLFFDYLVNEISKTTNHRKQLSFGDFVTRDGLSLTKRLYAFLRQRFLCTLGQLDIMGVVKEFIGERAFHEHLESQFMAAAPLWNWDPSQLYGGLTSTTSINALGIGELEWAEKIRRAINEDFVPVETKDPFAITILRTRHGIPLYALNSIKGDYHKSYEYFAERWKTGEGYPLHVSSQWEGVLPDLLPSMVYRFDEEWNKITQRIDRTEHEFRNSVVRFVEYLCPILGLERVSGGSLEVYRSLYCTVLDAATAFEGIRLPRILPLICLQRHELLDSDLDDIRHLLAKRMKIPYRTALLMFFGNKIALQRARQLLINRMRKPYAYDIIALGKADLQNILNEEEPQLAIRRLILQNIDLITVSPFVTSGPVPDNMFFGREGELREITEQARATNFILIGGRRIGKTSILHRLLRVRLPIAGYDTYYYGCEPTPTDKEFLKGISREWLQSSPLAFTEILDQLQSNNPLVILLDEVDDLVASDAEADYPLLSTFRSLSQSHECHFVLCGEWTLCKELRNSNSPLFNFGNELLIGRLDYRAVEELVTKPFKQLEIELVDEEDLAQGIYDFTSGHPNVVQRLCQRLVKLLNEKPTRQLTLDDLDAVIADDDFLRRDFLDTFWERATVLEKLISLVMTIDKNARTLASIRETLTKTGVEASVRQVDGALERLVDFRSILKRVRGGYEFAVTAFPKVLVRTTTLADAIEYQRELYLEKGDVNE